MKKKLRYWNGRPAGMYARALRYRSASFNIAAYSRAEAQRLCEQAGECPILTTEVRDYFSECWGNGMEGVLTETAGVWLTYRDEKHKLQTLKLI